MSDNKIPTVEETLKDLQDRVSKLEKQNCKHNYDRSTDDASKIVCRKCGDVR